MMMLTQKKTLFRDLESAGDSERESILGLGVVHDESDKDPPPTAGKTARVGKKLVVIPKQIQISVPTDHHLIRFWANLNVEYV